MRNLIDEKRINNIIDFLKSLNINSKFFNELLEQKNYETLSKINEALTHTSANKQNNHEKLEFFGDAVLRLAASEFIENHFQNIKVGERSELRAQIVSDEWLTVLGKRINIKKIIIVGPKVMGDKYSSDTIIAESTEALIGAIYKSCNSIKEINLWLDDHWIKDSKIILEQPYKYNAKSTLQEWCQEKKMELPDYRIKEISKVHGDPKKFLCEVFINGNFHASAYGQSHKKAEKKAALIAIEKINKKNHNKKLN